MAKAVGGARRSDRATGRWSIAARLFVIQVVLVLIGVATAITLLTLDARDRATQEAATRSMIVAKSVADNPFVIGQVQAANPSQLLQPYAVTLMRDTAVDFITVMAPDRTRYTHRDPTEIGKPFLGTIEPALRGDAFTETYTGTLGPSVRAVVPIKAAGSVIALVSAGITVARVDAAFGPRVQGLLAAGGGALVIGGVVTWLISRYLQRVTAGRGPKALGQVFLYYESALHAVHEGLVLVDDRGDLVLYNDHAALLLGLPRDGPARPVSELSIPDGLKNLLISSAVVQDAIFVTHDRVLVVNHRLAVPLGDAAPPGRRRSSRDSAPLGSVTTLRDHTELQRVSGELESVRTMAYALHSQTHEFSNRLHTIASLLELGRPAQALRFAADELNLSQRLADRVMVSIDEPVVEALMLGKSAQARERGVALSLDARAMSRTQSFEPADLVTIVGNLVDNAIDAAAGGGVAADPWVEVYFGLGDNADEVILQVSDSGPGIQEADFAQAFVRGFSTKPGGATGRGLGLALVRQTVERLGGTIEVSRHVGAVFTVTLPLPLPPRNDPGETR